MLVELNNMYAVNTRNHDVLLLQATSNRVYHEICGYSIYSDRWWLDNFTNAVDIAQVYILLIDIGLSNNEISTFMQIVDEHEVKKINDI